MPAAAYDYAIVRWVPRVDRGEQINVGIVAYCPGHDAIACRIELDEARARALQSDANLADVQRHLTAMAAVCRGDASGGPIASLPKKERFHWLVHPRSAGLQVSEVHAGTTDELTRTVDALFARLVTA